MPDLPEGLTQPRNVDLRGRTRHPWVRRALVGATAVLPVLALLDVFGQHPHNSRATSSDAALRVTAPSRLRSGLIYQARIQVVAHRDIAHPTLVFDRGWWESMSVNSIEPNPSNESSENGRVALSYDKLQAGQTLIAWIYFQVNPTNVGNRREDVQLDDGNTTLVGVRRSLTIFP